MGDEYRSQFNLRCTQAVSAVAAQDFPVMINVLSMLLYNSEML